MVDPVDLEKVECFFHIGRWTFFAGMRDKLQSQRAREGEDPRELRGRMADLRRIEPDAVDARDKGQRSIERRLGVRLAEMTKKAEDQFRGQTVLLARLIERAGNACDHGLEGDPALGMPLRIEKNLDVADIVCSRAGEIRGREFVEILFGDENAHSLVIDVEKILE